MTIRVLLADDHPVARAGIRAALEEAADIEIVGEAADGAEVQRLTAELRPDVVLLDLVMPDLRPAEFVRWARATCPETEVLPLTAHDQDYYLAGMLEAGAVDESVLIWTEMSSGYYNPWNVPIYGKGPDGQVVRLGRGAAGSEAVCGGRAYWKIEFGNRPTEIRSWVPGGAVEVIYRSPDVEECAGENDYSVTTPLCHSDLVLIGRHGCQADATEEILVARMP